MKCGSLRSACGRFDPSQSTTFGVRQPVAVFTPPRTFTTSRSAMSVMISIRGAPPEDLPLPLVADAVLGLRDGLSSKPKPQAPSPSSKP